MKNPPHVSFTKEPALKIFNNVSKQNEITRSILHRSPSLRSSISRELSAQIDCQREWNLMFSSSINGSSFPRLSNALAATNGPTLILIEEEETGEEQENNPKRSSPTIFGGFTNYQWTSVKARDLHAKAAAAARTRTERTGIAEKANRHASHDSSKKPTNQAPQFFGDSRCFVFTNVNKNKNDDVGGGGGDFEIFQTRDSGSLANANYVYYFDTHISSDNVGLGMGGSGTRSCVGNEAGMSFFIDRSLVSGQSCPGGCLTFQKSTQLSTRPTFKIRTLEIWSLNPQTIGLSSENDEENNTALKSKDHATAKALLQMNGLKLYSEENDRDDV